MENAESKEPVTLKKIFLNIKQNYWPRHKKYSWIIGIIVVFLLLGYFGRSLLVAATVNGSPISRLSIVKDLEKQSGQRALDGLITEKLIRDEAQKRNITISNDEITAEIETIRQDISTQGGSLEDVLAQQGLTEDDVRKQVTIRKEIEKMLGDTLTVTDEDVDNYLKQLGTPAPQGEDEVAFREQIKDQLKNQKFGMEADKLVTDLRSQANIKFYVWYGKLTPPLAPEEN